MKNRLTGCHFHQSHQRRNEHGQKMANSICTALSDCNMALQGWYCSFKSILHNGVSCTDIGEDGGGMSMRTLTVDEENIHGKPAF